jgi:N-acetylglutamate synthase-like GNAT family acetyltransferase
MPVDRVIEIATFEDTEELISLFESINVPTDDVDPDFTKFFIVREDSKIIGCVGLELFTGTALLRSFAIHSDHQDNEIGQVLIKKLIEEAATEGSDAVYVCSAGAPSFFLDLGFTGIDLDDVPSEIRTSGLFDNDCPRVAAFMMKRTL